MGAGLICHSLERTHSASFSTNRHAVDSHNRSLVLRNRSPRVGADRSFKSRVWFRPRDSGSTNDGVDCTGLPGRSNRITYPMHHGCNWSLGLSPTLGREKSLLYDPRSCNLHIDWHRNCWHADTRTRCATYRHNRGDFFGALFFYWLRKTFGRTTPDKRVLLVQPVRLYQFSSPRRESTTQHLSITTKTG